MTYELLISQKKNLTAKSAGCLKDFHFTHFTDHRRQLDELGVNRDLFRQTRIQQRRRMPKRIRLLSVVKIIEKKCQNYQVYME